MMRICLWMEELEKLIAKERKQKEVGKSRSRVGKVSVAPAALFH
jgi:hypothetical protein